MNEEFREKRVMPTNRFKYEEGKENGSVKRTITEHEFSEVYVNKTREAARRRRQMNKNKGGK